MASFLARALIIVSCLVVVACASPSRDGAAASEPDHYLDQCAFKIEPGNDWKLLRWREREMPLQVFLPPPPPGLFEDDEAVLAAVREGIRAWEGVAKRGVPSFEFLDAPSEADILIRWTASTDGYWAIAHTAIMRGRSERLEIDNLLITGTWQGGKPAPLDAIRTSVAHEIGHALGIGGHSGSPDDIMYATYDPEVLGLSARDRATLRRLYAAPVGKRMSGARKSR
jgi:hypothetical protein